MNKVVSVSPFRCRMWTLHDRLEDHITEESCRSEIESFERHGQLVPVLGRPVRDDTAFDVELIYGARRLFVARHLNVPLMVEIRDVSDREGIVAMDIENRHRKDISPYERGLSYAHWIRAKYFESQDDIAKALKVSPSQVSRLLKLAGLPSVIISAFEDPLQIRERWGLELLDAWQDPRKRRLIGDRARSIAKEKPRPCAEVVHRRLLASNSSGGKRGGTGYRDEVVMSSEGAGLFRVRIRRDTVALVLSANVVSSESLSKIKLAIVEILQRTSSKDVVSKGELEFGSSEQQRLFVTNTDHPVEIE